MNDSRGNHPVPLTTRRGWLASVSRFIMLGGLAGGYGAFAAIAARFLYPARHRAKRWMFVTEAARLKAGDSLLYITPAGEKVNVTRQRRSGGVSDFTALSSTCPHLGCQVHWQTIRKRYFCPCHNGTFDATGKATGGPPGEAGQSLSSYALRIEHGLLYMETPVDILPRPGGRSA
ncbi:MAG: ubiquinol-cytochrome c reductase iron-sulfur subunit [Acidobacteriota bacterium]